MIDGRVVCVAVPLALLSASTAAAQPRGPLSLTWDAPAGCPTRDEVIAAVERLRPHAFQRPATHPVVAEGRVSPDGARWSLSLTTRAADGAGTRALTADTCAEAADAAAVVLALAIDPTSRRAPPSPPEPAAPAARPDDGPRFVTRVHGALDLGTLPAPAPGLGASAGFVWRWLRVELGATWFPSQRAPGAGGVSSDVGLVSGELRACATPLRIGRVAAGACAGLAGGAMYAEGVGFDRNRDGLTPWWSSLAGLIVRVALTRALTVTALAEAGVTLGDPRFVAGDGAVLHRPSRVTARGTAGVELRLP